MCSWSGNISSRPRRFWAYFAASRNLQYVPVIWPPRLPFSYKLWYCKSYIPYQTCRPKPDPGYPSTSANASRGHHPFPCYCNSSKPCDSEQAESYARGKLSLLMRYICPDVNLADCTYEKVLSNTPQFLKCPNGRRAREVREGKLSNYQA